MEEFLDNEKLFRAVLPPTKNRLLWTKDGKRISSIAFKNRPKEEYVSVLRQGDRSTENCVNDIKRFLHGSIVSVTCSQCENTDVSILMKPSQDNQYHCGLVNGEENAKTTLLTDKQCQDLADMAIIEFKDF